MPVNLGSFGQGQPGGAGDALQQAIQRRQQGGQPVPALSQVTPGAAQGPSPQPPSVPAGAPQAIPAGVSAGPQKPPLTEAQEIEKAFAQRLASISKVEEAQVIPPKAPAQSPQQAPVGGGGNPEKKSQFYR